MATEECRDSPHQTQDMANLYFDTFKQLRKAYDNNASGNQGAGTAADSGNELSMNGNNNEGRVTMINRPILNKRALEDQVCYHI